MKPLHSSRLFLLQILLLFVAPLQAQQQEIDRLVGALLGDTPMMSDLQQLCDEVGGRPTGSPANRKAVEWAMKKFQNAGVLAKKEGFMMPRFWLERSAEAVISGDGERNGQNQGDPDLSHGCASSASSFCLKQ